MAHTLQTACFSTCGFELFARGSVGIWILLTAVKRRHCRGMGSGSFLVGALYFEMQSSRDFQTIKHLLRRCMMIFEYAIFSVATCFFKEDRKINV